MLGTFDIHTGIVVLENTTNSDQTVFIYVDNKSEFPTVLPAKKKLQIKADSSSEAFYYLSQQSKEITVSYQEDTSTVDVTDATGFDEAINNPEVSTINLTGTVSVDSIKSFDRPITIQGGTLEFSQTGQNLVLLDGGTLKGVTIKNTSETNTVTRQSTWTSTYGLQVYKGTATIEDCTFVGGNAGLLVNGATVTLSGVTTISDMSFGGIEVSKGTGVETPGVLTVNGTVINNNEAYGKPTIWVDGTTTDIGQVNDTNNQFTEVIINNQNQYYLNEQNTWRVFTDVDTYVSETNTGNFDGKDVVLNIDGQSYTNQSIGLSQQQNRENPPKLHLNVTNTTFDGATELGKQIYVTNIQSMTLDNCEFKNNSVSDYGVDVNLCTIQNSNIEIKNCKFESTGVKAALKISQRKGSTDHPTDITVTTPATIENVLIENCSFSGNVRDYNVGTTPKGDDVAANTTTGAYPVTISNCTTNVVVAEPYLVDKDADVPLTTVLAGTIATKTATGQFFQE